MNAYSVCGECQHMQALYWDNGFTQEHHCGKSRERRRDAFRTTGDPSQDFLNDFRMFYDASAKQRSCKYFELRGFLDSTKRNILVQISAAGGAKGFPFFSEENRACESMSNKFVSNDRGTEERHGEVRGWKLTSLGKFEVSRCSSVPVLVEIGGAQ